MVATTTTPARAQAPARTSYAPAGWDDGAKLREAVDTNPDPNVVEVNLTAKLAEVEVAPGKKVTAWTYDGGLPGHLCEGRQPRHRPLQERARRGHHRALARRAPNIDMDGVPGISQPPVKKGESFVYDFVVPDASLYWYHPHVMSNAQVGFGLYGPLLVEDPNDGVNVADETTLVLSDIGFDSKACSRIRKAADWPAWCSAARVYVL